MVKKFAAQINVTIHAVGILISLPHILKTDEVIESLSLGAGNTGRPFDLVTNCRIAEFKFINWQGGPEAIRQNSLFQDFFNLAEWTTEKERYLYVIGDEIPLRFFRGNRDIKSVMSKNTYLQNEFDKKYVGRFTKICHYYEEYKNLVQIVDISMIVPQFAKEFQEPKNERLIRLNIHRRELLE